MQQYPLKEEHQIVKNMEQNSSSSNADFAVLLHNGSVGGQLISVSPVIRNKWLEIMFQELPQYKGGRNCPLKVDHPENGDEYSLGCAICRNAAANQKEF